MKKLYQLQWQHITGTKGVLQTNTLFEFYRRLSELLEDYYVSDSSISFATEEVSLQELKPVENLLVVDERESEYQRFKGNRK